MKIYVIEIYCPHPNIRTTFEVIAEDLDAAYRKAYAAISSLRIIGCHTKVEQGQ